MTDETLPSLEPVLPGLFATRLQPLSFAPTLGVRAFLLERARGNLVVYATETLAAAGPAIAERGGAVRQYLNHWHEAAVAGGAPAARLHCHAADRAEVESHLPVAEAFEGPHRLDDDFEAIPIPGHTSGATAYLWAGPAGRCLFTGDSVYFRRGEWRAALLELERPRRLHREPRAPRRAPLRPAGPVGRAAPRAGVRRDRPGRRRPAARADHRPLAERRGSLASPRKLRLPYPPNIATDKEAGFAIGLEL